MAQANLATCLKPGGSLLLRDYCSGDRAQQKLLLHTDYFSCLNRRLLLRPDGTLARYLEKSDIEEACNALGLHTCDISIVERLVCNRKQSKQMWRKFIQARITKNKDKNTLIECG
jgi:hypothetical protein